MSPIAAAPEIIEHAPISTWFRCGGSADRFARPRGLDELRRCVDVDPDLRIVGDGANLLVSDEGVGELVVALDAPELSQVDIDPATGRVEAGAGAPLPKVISQSVKSGLGGLEKLAGIPASVGGAIAMNAGGSFGAISDTLESVRTVDRAGNVHERSAEDLGLGYRTAHLNNEIVVSAVFRLEPGDSQALHDRLVEVMGYKKRTQPLSDRSAGCAFRNPTLELDLDGIGAAGERVSAGLLIDRAGCKGLRVGGAEVSSRHANFVTTDDDALAADVVGLMVEVAGRVHEHSGVRLRPEIVIWRREPNQRPA
ncbi:MAG: UDP-N-acetylmuramate dehydrogenase [Planctomycetota bacterium]